jgi:hypothetical protein
MIVAAPSVRQTALVADRAGVKDIGLADVVKAVSPFHCGEDTGRKRADDWRRNYRGPAEKTRLHARPAYRRNLGRRTGSNAIRGMNG